MAQGNDLFKKFHNELMTVVISQIRNKFRHCTTDDAYGFATDAIIEAIELKREVSFKELVGIAIKLISKEHNNHVGICIDSGGAIKQNKLSQTYITSQPCYRCKEELALYCFRKRVQGFNVSKYNMCVKCEYLVAKQRDYYYRHQRTKDKKSRDQLSDRYIKKTMRLTEKYRIGKISQADIENYRHSILCKRDNRIILDQSTGIFYTSLSEAAKAKCIGVNKLEKRIRKYNLFGDLIKV